MPIVVYNEAAHNLPIVVKAVELCQYLELLESIDYAQSLRFSAYSSPPGHVIKEGQEVIMVYRTPSGHVIGSTKPGARSVDPSRVIDPTCYPSPTVTPSAKQPQTSQPSPPQPFSPDPLAPNPSATTAGSYKFEALPSFPRTLFEWEKYDGARALVSILLMLATTYFLAGFLGFLVDHTPWLKDLLQPAAVANTAKVPWWHLWRPIASTVTHIASYVDLAFRLFVFLCAYCLAWATFDPRNIEGYVMGFFNTCLGLAYMISPIDAIPDFVPVAGNLDDAVLGTGVLLLGLSSLYRNKLREVKTKTILELIDDGNNQKALQMLLEDKGITIKDS